jgi:hypothetical protein
MSSDAHQNLTNSRRSKSFQRGHAFFITLLSPSQVSLVHDHSPEQWGLPEQVYHELSSVSHYEFRVASRILMAEFDELVQDFKQKFENISKTMHFLEHNSSIKQFARSLLSVGDFLNYVS